MSSGSSPASDPPVPADFDADPARFRSARHAVAAWGSDDVHAAVADRIDRLPPGPVLDVGCGDGALHEASPPAVRRRWVGLDRSHGMLAGAPRPVIRADARCLPVATRSVVAVAALWLLYHLDEPAVAIEEAARVLRRDGELYTCSTRRDDSPELADHFENPASTFDAEEAPDLVARSFRSVEVRSWDAPLVHLPDRDAVRTYLRGRGASPEAAASAADELPAPLAITKRGSLVIGREPR